MVLLSALLRQSIRWGTLTVIDAADRRHRFGSVQETPVVTIRFHDRLTPWKIAIQPNLRLGEAIADGTLTVENGTVYDLLALLGHNHARMSRVMVFRVAYLFERLLRRLHQFNPVTRARNNVAHHYDLSGHLYALFLDSDWQYSCAYFPDGDESLDEAQEKKKSRIAAKLRLEKGQRVLDIGSGWGGMALSLAQLAEVRVKGITLSDEQLKIARRRADKERLAHRVSFDLVDYRKIGGQFDRIVSVGMFEHVGVGFYSRFFTRLRELLAEDGVALLHTIGRSTGPGATNPWIRKYIFPGGYIPALSEIAPAIEKAGLVITDIEVLRQHYADTLRHWRERFLANRHKALALYDERFCRMWEFYLAASEVAFRHLGMVVFQIQLASHQEAVPLSRAYIEETERKIARRLGDRAAA